MGPAQRQHREYVPQNHEWAVHAVGKLISVAPFQLHGIDLRHDRLCWSGETLGHSGHHYTAGHRHQSRWKSAVCYMEPDCGKGRRAFFIHRGIRLQYQQICLWDNVGMVGGQLSKIDIISFVQLRTLEQNHLQLDISNTVFVHDLDCECRLVD